MVEPERLSIAVAKLAERTGEHWVISVEDTTGELARVWLEHDPDVPPSVLMFGDALRCRGFFAYPPDLRRWVVRPRHTEVHLARSPVVVSLAEAIADWRASNLSGFADGDFSDEHPMRLAAAWLRAGLTPAEALARLTDRPDAAPAAAAST